MPFAWLAAGTLAPRPGTGLSCRPAGRAGEEHAAQGPDGRGGRGAHPRRRHDHHLGLHRDRRSRGAADGARGALPRGAGAAQPRAPLRGGPGRFEGARAQPSRARGAAEAGRGRPLGPDPEGGGAGARGQDGGLEPAAGGDQPSLPRHRRGKAGHADAGGPRHLRRSAARGRADQRDLDRGSHRGDGGRRQGISLLQGLPDRRGAPARHHRRRGGQRHHGARGADPRQPRAGHGGAQFRGAGDRAGRADRREPQPEPARGRAAGAAGRCGGGGAAGAAHADLRHQLFPGLRRGDPRTLGRAAAAAARRPQDRRAPRRLRAADQRRGQSRDRACRRASRRWRARRGCSRI